VTLSGAYTNRAQLDDPTSKAYATLTVMVPPATNSTRGAATITKLSNAAGKYADASGASYTFGLTYNKGGTNPQGQIQLLLPRSDGTYYVKSNSLSSLAFANPVIADGGLPKDVTIYTKASIYKIDNLTGAITSIDGNVTLRVDAHEGCSTNATDATACMTTGGDTIGFTVLSSKTSALYYSNNWQYDSPSKSYRTVNQSVSSSSPNIGVAVAIN
jgi:hypothetical protein